MLHGTFAAFVKDIWTEELTESVTVYNFEVAVAHTYFVSKRNVLVHNRNCKTSKRFNDNQQTVLELAKDSKKSGGIKYDDANTLVDWAKEYGMDSHYPDIHPNRPDSIWSKKLHINIFNMHIPVIK